MAWDDAKKQKAVDMYLALKPTAETSMECVKEVAEKLDETANGVRMILSKAEVYVKKAEATSGKAEGSEKKSTGVRVSKEGAIEDLKKVLEAAGAAIDEDILSKLTGKAAVYFAGVVKSLSKE